MLFPALCKRAEEAAQNKSTAQNENSKKKSIIVENATLDVDTYIRQYEGPIKIIRLLFVADHCPNLRLESLQLALEIVKTTHNTDLYQYIFKQLQKAVSTTKDVSTDTLSSLDTRWIENTSRRAQLTLERFDTDLKNYKNNSIKESIRRANDDLGEHYLDMGDFTNASKSFARTRDYCTTVDHFITMCLNIIKVSVFSENWPQVMNNYQKAENTLVQFKDLDNVDRTKIKCAAGLAELVTGKYKAAAKYFFQASFDHFDYPELLSVSNVATYGTLCALASFDRKDLRKNITSNPGFKLFVDSEPQLRLILEYFCQSKYYSCLKLMAEIQNNLLLDVFLSSHVSELYLLIRKKALCQYFDPYLSADMHKMAEAFNTNVKDLEDELMQLILEGEITARIDSHNKVLHAKDIDQRSSTFEKSIAMVQEYDQRIKALIIRSATMKNQIIVMSSTCKDNTLPPLTPGSNNNNNNNIKPAPKILKLPI